MDKKYNISNIFQLFLVILISSPMQSQQNRYWKYIKLCDFAVEAVQIKLLYAAIAPSKVSMT